MGEDVAALAAREIVFAPTYQWVSYLRFFKVDAAQIFPEGRRSNFTLSPVDICARDEAVVFLAASSKPAALSCFPHGTVLKQYPLVVRGVPLETYLLVRYDRGPDRGKVSAAAVAKAHRAPHRWRRRRP